jgi:hypothetical protein
MKKIYTISTFLCLIIAMTASTTSYAFADDDDMSSSGIDDAYKYSSTMDNAFVGQKKVTDEEFQKALTQAKSRKKVKRKDRPMAGKTFNEENNGGYLKETAENNLLLGLPVELITVENVEIPIGHYKIVGKKVGDKLYLEFYQSYTLVAKVPATETKNDFDQPTISFVKLIPYNKNKVEIIYGSMDFNAYTFIKIKNEISDQN